MFAKVLIFAVQYNIDVIGANLAVSGSGIINQEGVISTNYYTLIKNVQIRENITEIGISAFKMCSQLVNVSIETDKLKKIRNDAFQSLSKLQYVTFCQGLEELSSNSFFATGLLGVTFPPSIVTIGGGSFVDSKCQYIVFEEPSNLKYIGVNAFSSTKITSIVLPDSLETCSLYAFRFTNLPSIKFGTKLKSMGPGALANMVKLKEVVVHQDNPNYCSLDNVIYSKDQTVLVDFLRGFEGEFKVPDTVQTIEVESFEGSSYLTSVIFGANLTKVRVFAFRSCTALTNITVSESTTTLEDNCFEGCNLSTFYFGKNLVNIGNGIFSGNPDTKVTVDPNHTTLYQDPAQKIIYTRKNDPRGLISIPSDITDAVIDDYVALIPQSFFESCKVLKSIILPKNLKTISRYGLVCPNLLEITIPKSCQTIGEYVARGNSQMRKFNFEDDSLLLSLPIGLIEKTAVEEITFGQNCGILSFGAECFRYSNLKRITIPDSVTKLGDKCFLQCQQLEALTINSNIIGLGKSIIESCNKLKEITINCSTIQVESFLNSKYLEKINFKENVDNIEGSAFGNCIMLKEVKFDENIKELSIGPLSFSNSGLIEITLPSKLKNFTSNAFSFSKDLINIFIAENLNFVSNNGIIYSVDNETMITCPSGRREAILIPEAKIIGRFGFYGCDKMEKVEMGENILNISERCFYGCNSLKTVNIPRGIISIGENAFEECNNLNTVFFCSNSSSKINFVNDPFEENVKIYVPSTYKEDSFISHSIIKSSSLKSDGCPNIPSNEFSKRKKKETSSFWIKHLFLLYFKIQMV